MAKESKQERIVRGMFEQVLEHLHELKALTGNPATKELDVERWCQSVVRGCLGFTASNGYTIRSQETRGKMRPDLIVLRNEKPICVIEVKKLGFELDELDVSKRAVEETCWNLLDLHETTYTSGTWTEYSREAAASKPSGRLAPSFHFWTVG